jgi:Transposase DDE domain group 1
MVSHSAWQHTFGLFSKKPIVVEPVDAHLTSDAGLLPIRQFDQLIGLTEAMAGVLEDHRHPSWTQHGFGEMVRSRVFGIIADYEDQNDHDVLRSDPVFKLIAGRSPDASDLASQPTLSRFENAITVPMLRRLQDVFIDQFIASFETPPTRLTFDIDTYDDRRGRLVSGRSIKQASRMPTGTKRPQQSRRATLMASSN